ncbi:Mobile element protein [Micrococcus lylae]|uniref:Mobile element protein n=1 Tax=Micrococcus lylae TaxID=1273 RepID=A0A1R4K065_9MICC|nr:Mobile element protein [Micrococcus lylae]
MAELEKENREVRRANAILRSASAFFAADARDAHSADRGLRRRPEGRIRCRADLHHTLRSRHADRTEHVLRREDTSCLGPPSAR